MKHACHLIFIGLLTLLPACSTPPATSTLQPVGPAPSGQAAASHQGFLKVYSAWELFRFYHSNFDRHSDYTIATPEGKLVRRVQNYLDRFDDQPVLVSLPPGGYQVTARALHAGSVTVPVVVEEGETTLVYLDGTTQPDVPAAQQKNLVRLQDGQVVGWSAK